ncbi:MAG TPA: peptidoglycan DD-metalloendopeptidase family protein [Rhizomicrobium sp.]
MRLKHVLTAFLVACAPSFAGADKVPVPRPRPAAARPAPPLQDGVTDLSHAIPAKGLSKLPPTADQFQTLKQEIAKNQPEVATARKSSETLTRQAERLQRKLVTMAARVEELEREKAQLGADIARLSAENARLSAGFARDRVAVSRLLAVLERLQHDMPPAMALRPNDALAAARGAMLVGASLPNIYGEAAALARRIETLRNTRLALIARRAEAERNGAYLAQARIELDQLLAMKRLEADAAVTHYGDLKAKLDTIASQAADLKSLLEKVAALRAVQADQSVVTVTAEKGAGGTRLGRDLLVCPVVGEPVSGGMDGVGGAAAPGLTYATASGAQVISPADGRVVFAGPYHKSGQALILEMAGGYDAVLVGLDRLEVRLGNRVLAGEPVGMMSKTNLRPRLYFELQLKGRGLSPAPYLSVTLRKAKRS